MFRAGPPLSLNAPIHEVETEAEISDDPLYPFSIRGTLLIGSAVFCLTLWVTIIATLTQ